MFYKILALVMIAAFACNEESISLSTSELTPNKDEADAAKGEVGEPPAVEELPSPKKWPKCWLSSRLSTVNAQRIAGFGSNTQVPPLYSAAQGRQEFRGLLKNPTAEGNCVLNWSGQDHRQEPWVLRLQEQYPAMHAALTCTAKSTPECHCISLLPEPPYDGTLSLIIGTCVREAVTGGHELYDVRDPDNSHTVPDNGRCNAARAETRKLVTSRLGDEGFLQQTVDDETTPTANLTCRTDFEPFAPLDDEKDWYASDIRDWAITSCQDQTTNCRCYVIHNKSGHEEGKRGMGIESGTCLLCENGTCQQAAMSSTP